ncbi:hypothetical protein ACWGAN_17855 [Streptomyces sp. NPDC054945]
MLTDEFGTAKHAALGRFISVDPALSIDQHQSVNGFSYANNGGWTKGDYIEDEDEGEDEDEDDDGGGGGGGGKQGATAVPATSPASSSASSRRSWVPPTIAAPEGAKERACQFDPVLSCNPEDAVHGAGAEQRVGDHGGMPLGNGGIVARNALWRKQSGRARREKSDLSAAHRNEIGQLFNGNAPRSGESTSSSIGDKDAAGRPVQLREGLTAIATHDDAKSATTVLRSYTANHETLRVGVNGVQARIFITNGMTVSPFAHAKTGYGTPADRILQNNVDHVGVMGHGKGQAMTSLPSGRSAKLQLRGSE